MSWNFLQSEGTSAFGSVHAVPFPADVQADSLILVVYGTLSSASPTILSISDTHGNTYTSFAFRAGFGGSLAGHWAVNSSAGANTVTVTLDGSRGVGIVILEYDAPDAVPFDQTAGVDAAVGSTDPNGDQTPLITPTVDGALIVGAILSVTGGGTTAFAPGDSPVAFTERDSTAVSGWEQIQVQDAEQATAAAIRATWTANLTDRYHAFVASFKPAAGAPAAELEANATLAITASASLTTAITLAGSATLSLTSSAALTTAITLAASAVLRLTAAATLTAGPIVSIPPALRTDVEWFMVRPAVAFRTARTSTAPLILHTTVEQGQ